MLNTRVQKKSTKSFGWTLAMANTRKRGFIQEASSKSKVLKDLRMTFLNLFSRLPRCRRLTSRNTQKHSYRYSSSPR